MERFARLFAILALVTFAVGMAPHEAHATAISVAMMQGDMGDCRGCPPGDDGKAPTCIQGCPAPLAAIRAAAGFELPFGACEITALPLREIVGVSPAPDPSPPRTTIL